jgi:DNA-binding NarL/FixJ family response regulator
MNILIYEDHAFVTQAIEDFFLAQSKNINIVQKHTIADVINYINEYDIEIIVSDLLSDEDAGFKLFEHVFKFFPHIKIVVYTGVSSEFIKKSLMEMGVSRIINKKQPLIELWQTVSDLCQTLTPSPSKVIAKTPLLTKKEKEIALLLAKGLSAKEIADLLSSSVNTINNQKNNLIEKFGCTNSTELVVKLAQAGLITLL